MTFVALNNKKITLIDPINMQMNLINMKINFIAIINIQINIINMQRHLLMC
jgi:hypothetical protein